MGVGERCLKKRARKSKLLFNYKNKKIKNIYTPKKKNIYNFSILKTIKDEVFYSKKNGIQFPISIFIIKLFCFVKIIS